MKPDYRFSDDPQLLLKRMDRLIELLEDFKRWERIEKLLETINLRLAAKP